MVSVSINGGKVVSIGETNGWFVLLVAVEVFLVRFPHYLVCYVYLFSAYIRCLVSTWLVGRKW